MFIIYNPFVPVRETYRKRARGGARGRDGGAAMRETLRRRQGAVHLGDNEHLSHYDSHFLSFSLPAHSLSLSLTLCLSLALSLLLAKLTGPIHLRR